MVLHYFSKYSGVLTVLHVLTLRVDGNQPRKVCNSCCATAYAAEEEEIIECVSSIFVHSNAIFSFRFL